MPHIKSCAFAIRNSQFTQYDTQYAQIILRHTAYHRHTITKKYQAQLFVLNLNRIRMAKATKHDSSPADLDIANCQLYKGSRPVWDQATWESLQNAYRRAVGTKTSTISRHKETGIQVPYEVRVSPDKGRGVFATEKVRRGQIVWKMTQHAKFFEEAPFRRFLSSLSYDLACDVLMWAYVEKDAKHGFAVAIELDEGSYFNNGNSKAEVNTMDKYGVVLDDGNSKAEINAMDSVGVFAIRDIPAGEEILMNYTEFDNDDQLMWFDDLWAEAWEDPEDGSSSSFEDGADLASPLLIGGSIWGRLGSKYPQQDEQSRHILAMPVLLLCAFMVLLFSLKASRLRQTCTALVRVYRR
jgi:hypothetical protein